MKTAYEESRTAIFDIARRSGILRAEFEREITRIQLDAAKRGMELAAEVCKVSLKDGSPYVAGCIYSNHAILTLRDNLTIEQLNK
jgi:hypothetical protein